jgi:hypothetical protein
MEIDLKASQRGSQSYRIPLIRALLQSQNEELLELIATKSDNALYTGL